MGGENPTQCAGDSSLGQRVYTMECNRPFWSASCQHVAAFSSSSLSLFTSTRTLTAVCRLMRRRPRLRPQGCHAVGLCISVHSCGRVPL